MCNTNAAENNRVFSVQVRRAVADDPNIPNDGDNCVISDRENGGRSTSTGKIQDQRLREGHFDDSADVVGIV